MSVSGRIFTIKVTCSDLNEATSLKQLLLQTGVTREKIKVFQRSVNGRGGKQPMHTTRLGKFVLSNMSIQRSYHYTHLHPFLNDGGFKEKSACSCLSRLAQEGFVVAHGAGIYEKIKEL